MSDELPPSNEITTLFSYDTEYSADSVEWCPHEPHQNVFVCGNYQLKENEAKTDIPCERLGRILLFSIDPEVGLKLHQTIDTAAVLDQKWCHNQIDNFSILGVVNAKKSLEIYKFNDELFQLELICDYALIDGESETLILSLDWSTGKYPSNEPEIVCSDSKGNVHRFVFNRNRLELCDSWHGHEYEAWICGFNYWDPNIIFSGGDDCLFLKFDKRIGGQPVARNRSHEAGVTSLHSNSEREHVIASGSYDANIRIWDTRNMKNPTSTTKMPGTLWRLKWDPFQKNFLLAACMLGGVHILDTTKTPKITESYYQHKNISYGSDWCHFPEEKTKAYQNNGNTIIATCSFYDHLLCVSKLTI